MGDAQFIVQQMEKRECDVMECCRLPLILSIKAYELQVEGDSVIFGEPQVFTKKNIDDFDF